MNSHLNDFWYVNLVVPRFFVLPGKRLVLEVLVEGRPEPLVTWYKDGVELSASPHFEISCVDGRARLVILSPQASDSGEYACIARNHLGEARSSARITFKGD